MKKILSMFFITVFVLSSVAPSMAATTQVDSLIEKLVDKGILTRTEGLKLKGEIAADEKVLREEGLKVSLPEWVQKMKLKGDFRLRYQFERRENDTDGRARGRVRYRLGIETEVVKNVKVGAGLASGADDPRSTNQTFTDTFETSDIRLDYAYAEWAAINSDKSKVSLIGGLHPRSNYLWTPTDLLWDSDVIPQGGAVHAEYKVLPQVTAYLNNAVWVLDENNKIDKPDPFLHANQAGLKWKNGPFSANVAGTYYAFNGLKQTCPDWSSATNTGITSASSGSCSGSLKYDYDSMGGSAEFAWAKPFGQEIIPSVGVFGDYISNMDADENNLDHGDGFAVGAYIGDAKVNGKGQWQAKYIFARLGKDAWPDFLPDSDRFGGATDVKSHEAILEYGLTKNVILGLDYYQSVRLKSTQNPEHLFQADVNFKF